LPLPFISYGGTALVMSLFMAGVLANISARNPEPKPMPLWQALRFRGPRVKNRKAAAAPKIIVHVNGRVATRLDEPHSGPETPPPDLPRADAGEEGSD
jgi:hypothetical protein